MNYLIERITGKSIWNIFGDFEKQEEELITGDSKFTAKTDYYTVESSYTEDESGLLRYTGKLKNTSSSPIKLNCLNAKFSIGGGEYLVYTQYNAWQNESIGGWHRLNTCVSAEGKYSRTSSGANAILALWNEQNNHGIVFHLMSKFAWEMKASNVIGSGVEVEIGINRENLNIALNPGECIDTPDIIMYEFTNKLDFDAYKLHNYCNNNFKKKPVSITYNTWLAHFDKVSVENVMEQIPVAAKLGAEYYVIDAGWFGKGTAWWSSRGDWKENETGGFYGKMNELADAVRANNMKFGLWFEIESADPSSDIFAAHPEYFIKRGDLCFLNFDNPEARKYILEALYENIEKYNIEYIKFDYNQDMCYDGDRLGFTGYFKGYDIVIDELKKKYPEIYLENCASGGQRMNLSSCEGFDGFWPSDNESPYEQIKMFKNTLLRLPPNYFDRWITVSSIADFGPVYEGDVTDMIISSNDATWDVTIGVKPSFLDAFLTGGSIGISCDLMKFSDSLIELLKKRIEKLKAEKEFWNNCVCRILSDTPNFLIFEYSDYDLTKIKITVFAYKKHQNDIIVYPAVDSVKQYRVNDEVISGADIIKKGIRIPVGVNFDGTVFEFEEAR